MDLSLFFAGTGGSVPSARRGLPAVLVRRGGDRLLFDCGEGTQRQLLRSVGLADMDCVFITHFHADHWLGLPGMLKSFALRDRERPLTIYGPPGLNELMASTRFIYGRRLPYELSYVELGAAEAVERDGYRVAAVPVSHRSASAYGYVIVEDPRPGHLDPQLAERLGVRPGPDFGRLVRGEVVNGVSPEQVMGETREGRKVVLSGDTSPCEALAIAVAPGRCAGARGHLHRGRGRSRPSDRPQHGAPGGRVGAASGSEDAVLTHLSTRYAGGEVRREARAAFPDTEVPRDFDTIEVPFPERGSATLIRWADRLAAAGEGSANGSGEQGGGKNRPNGNGAAASSINEGDVAAHDVRRAVVDNSMSLPTCRATRSRRGSTDERPGARSFPAAAR